MTSSHGKNFQLSSGQYPSSHNHGYGRKSKPTKMLPSNGKLCSVADLLGLQKIDILLFDPFTGFAICPFLVGFQYHIKRLKNDGVFHFFL